MGVTAARTIDWERIDLDYRAGVKTLRQIADKAVACGTVKPDPQSLIPGSSNLADIQDILANLSSTLQPK